MPSLGGNSRILKKFGDDKYFIAPAKQTAMMNGWVWDTLWNRNWGISKVTKSQIRMMKSVIDNWRKKKRYKYRYKYASAFIMNLSRFISNKNENMWNKLRNNRIGLGNIDHDVYQKNKKRLHKSMKRRQTNVRCSTTMRLSSIFEQTIGEKTTIAHRKKCGIFLSHEEMLIRRIIGPMKKVNPFQ